MSFPLPLIPFIFTKHTLPPFMSFCLWCRHQVRFARVPYRNVDAGLSLQPLRGGWVHGWGKHPHLIPLPHLRFSSLPSLDPSSIQSFRLPLEVTVMVASEEPFVPRVYQTHMKSQTMCSYDLLLRFPFPHAPPHTPLWFPSPSSCCDSFIYFNV